MHARTQTTFHVYYFQSVREKKSDRIIKRTAQKMHTCLCALVEGKHRLFTIPVIKGASHCKSSIYKSQNLSFT